MPKNIWDAKHKGNGQVKNNIFGLSKQIEILNGTPIFSYFMPCVIRINELIGNNFS